MAKKKKKWVLFRHRVVRNIAYCIIGPWSRLKYKIKIEKFKKQGKRQYLILFNHQTAFDQFFVGLAFKGPVYFVASEDLFSKGWISRLLQWAIAPIPIKKQATDPRAVLNCMRVMREGGTIAIAPEGNRTYSGKTEYIKPAIVALARALKLPIAFYRIEGGYGVQPRWSDVVRKGKMRGYISRVLEPEDYANMSDEEFYNTLYNELYINECEIGGEFFHKELAQYIERAYYVCPTCGLSEFHSEKDIVSCKKCGMKAKYLPNKHFESIVGDFPFQDTNEWYDYQAEFIHNLDLSAYLDTPMYEENAKMSEVALYDKKRLLCENATISLFGDRLEVEAGEESGQMPFEQIRAVTVLGRNKLNVYFQDRVLQFKGNQRFNAVKYVQIFNHWKNVEKGDADGKFLGL